MARKHWIDNLRWATVLLVLFYHVFYFYNNKGVFGGIGGFVDDPMRQPQDVVMYILYPWFMMLLFLVAGISSRYALGPAAPEPVEGPHYQTHKQFIKSRTLKLLVPSTIGLFVFHWMTGYFNTAVARGTGVFADVPAVVMYFICAISGTGPLWFIQDLWIFSLLLVLVRKIDKNDRFWKWCEKASIPVIILLGVLVWLGSQALIMNPRPESADGLYNLYKPLTYFVPFLLGYFVFSHDEVQEKVEKIHLPMLIGAVATGVALVWTGWGKCNTDPQFLAGWLNCLYAWLMILAMLGCFKAWFDKTSAFATYMTKSSFGIYIVHYLVIASLGYMMKTYTSLAPWMMYVILFFAVMLLSPAIYEVVKRIPFVRWCVLGEKKRR